VPSSARLRAFRTPVRGHAFSAVPPTEAPAPGQPAELTREPGNPADPWAVAIWTGSTGGGRWRVGYLDRGVAARVAPRLDAGARIAARVDGWVEEPEGRWRRPLLLLLPEPPADRARDDGGHDGRGSAARRVTRTAEPARPSTWGRPPGVRRRQLPSTTGER
jgi:hypothetical protein